MNKSLQCVALAKKAGRLSAGTQNVLDAVRAGKAVLVIAAADVSQNTAKLIHDKAAYYGVPLICTGFSRSELGAILGSAACACAAFTDTGFALMYQRATEEQRR